jgi:CRP-like cAMP-binding protein
MRKRYPLLYRDGEVVFEENSSGKEIYMIENGKVEIGYRLDRERRRIVLLEKGDFFGEMAPITGTVRSATAVAVGDTYLSSFTMEEMFDYIQTDREFMLLVLRKLISRLRETTFAMRALTSSTGQLEGAMAESSVSEELPPIDFGEEERISKESYRRLEKTISYLEEQIHEKDREIESLQSQLEKRKWFRR